MTSPRVPARTSSFEKIPHCEFNLFYQQYMHDFWEVCEYQYSMIIITLCVHFFVSRVDLFLLYSRISIMHRYLRGYLLEPCLIKLSSCFYPMVVTIAALRRTLRVLFAIARGLCIMTDDWVYDSVSREAWSDPRLFPHPRYSAPIPPSPSPYLRPLPLLSSGNSSSRSTSNSSSGTSSGTAASTESSPGRTMPTTRSKDDKQGKSNNSSSITGESGDGTKTDGENVSSSISSTNVSKSDALAVIESYQALEPVSVLKGAKVCVLGARDPSCDILSELVLAAGGRVTRANMDSNAQFILFGKFLC